MLVQYFSLISLSYNQSIWKSGFGNFQVINVFERKCPPVNASQQQLKPTEEIPRWIWETRHWYFLSRFTLFCLLPLSLFHSTCNKLLLAATSNSTLRAILYQSFHIYFILIQKSLQHPDSLQTLYKWQILHFCEITVQRYWFYLILRTTGITKWIHVLTKALNMTFSYEYIVTLHLK